MLKVWNDAYVDGHQFITDDKGMVLFDRSLKYDEFKSGNVTINVRQWSKWYKLKEAHPLEKSWFTRDLTIEDAILENYEKEK